MIYEIASCEDLEKMTHEELEEQANIVLYGNPYVIEEAMEREIFYWRIYIPSDKPIKYRIPKYRPWQKTVYCKQCGLIRSPTSASLCWRCFRTNAMKKYIEKMEWWEIWRKQCSGITMPDTAWWDDSDIPARSTPKAIIGWNPIKFKEGSHGF